MFSINAFMPLKKLRRNCIAFLTLIGLSFAATIAGARDASYIRLQNRTYTPLWYKIRATAGRYSSWRVVLPGERIRYRDHSRLSIKISRGSGQADSYTLAAGNTYILNRRHPTGRTRFVQAARSGWSAPKPPSADEFRRARFRVSYSPGGEFGPLERFIDRCERSGREYRLSLKDLAVACFIAQQKTGRLPQELRYLKGFTWFFGYMIDRNNNDVVLLGVKDPTRPPIDIDCLATAIKSAYTGRVPACSLDRHSNLKYQKSVVKGVPWYTRWAEIMIDADYDMKKVCQGRLNPRIDGLRSWYDLSLARLRRTLQPGKTASRWWFNFDSSPRRATVDSNGELAVLYRNPVRVSTEKQISGSFGTGAIDYDSLRFARSFTRHIQTLGKHYPSVGELLALYRVYDLMNHLRTLGRALPPAMKYWTDHYRHPYSGPPRVVPTLSRNTSFNDHKNGKRMKFTFKVSGGVQMRLGVSSASVGRSPARPELYRRILSEKRRARTPHAEPAAHIVGLQ